MLNFHLIYLSSGIAMIFIYSLIVLMVGALTVNCSLIYYVTAEGKEHDCPLNETCYDLSYHISQGYYDSGTTFRLLPGIHYIPDGQVFNIESADSLVIEGYNATIIQGFHETVQQSTVIIQCIGQTGGIHIYYSYNITLRGLTIIDCGSEYYDDLDEVMYISISVFLTESLFLHNISIQNSTQYGLVTSEVDLLTIESCSFARNSLAHSKKFPCKSDSCRGGNAVVISSVFAETVVNIARSNFSFGISESSNASGLLMIIEEQDTDDSFNITLDSIVAYGNIGNLGANIALYAHTESSNYAFTLKNSLSTMANYQYDRSFGASIGGGFLAITSPSADDITNKIQIINSTFTNNAATYGGGICVLQLQDSTSTSIEVISSIIENNSGIIGIGIAVINIFDMQRFLNNLFITNTTISSSVISYSVNTFALFNLGSFNFDLELVQLKYLGTTCNIDDVASFSSAIGLVNAQNVTLNNNIIKDNAVSGIRAFHSRVIFKGNDNVIESNIGSNGGGLALLDESFLVLDPPTRVSFINNSAIRGGGIFTDEPLSSTNNTCFYAIQSHHDHPSISLIFKSNKASKGGSAIYGENIDNCLPHPDYNSSLLFNSSRNIFDTIFDYSKELGNSIISSNPFKVCLCEDSVANCTRRTHWLSSAPGGTVDLQVVLVGDQDGFSTGTLSIRPNNFGHLSFASILTTTAAECQNLSIPVILNDTSITSTDLVSSVNTNIIGRTIEEMTITISIEKCPIGFELHNSTGRCNCDSLLTSNFPNTICNVTKGLITKISSGWIGFEISENSSSCILLDTVCPFDYCTSNTNNTTITLEDQSQQCSMNRSGILCGQCKEGYSLMLGSNECGECPHYGYLALLIVFIVAGVALVVLLIVLNLTVSMSTINGLIFFANIVHINENSIFILTGHFAVLSQFISWINLDFGFKVCFYPGMDSYAKTWLQFAFPFYIWFTIALIILSAKYSTRISKVVSRNVVSVLATLILLSYTKLFRSIIFSFYRSNLISNCNSINTIVWSADGTINYFDLKHAPLFILSLMVLVLLIIPFTLSLLLSPLLESYLSRYKLFKWWIKLKPFIDAYNGPYKDRYRFWTGLLLLARLMIVLTVSFSNNLDVDRLVTLTVTVMLLSFSWMVNGVYTNRHSNTLEWFFIGNLAITISVSGYNDPLIRQILVYSCVSLSLMVFLGIISYHIWVRCSEIELIKKYISMAAVLLKRKKSTEVPKESTEVPKESFTLNAVPEVENQQNTDAVNRGEIGESSVDAISNAESGIENDIVIRKRESMIFDEY